MQVTLDLPDILAPQSARKVLEAVVLCACGEGTISQGKAGELLGLSFWETEQFFARQRVALAYAWEDLEKDAPSPGPEWDAVMTLRILPHAKSAKGAKERTTSIS